MRFSAELIAAGLLGCALAGSSEQATGIDPIGTWQTKSGGSHYDFAYCGEDGARLCARLSWLDATAMTTPAKDELGHYAIKEATHVGADIWKGPLSFQGRTVDATITFTGPKALTIAGCYFVLCKSFDLVKVSN